MGEFKDREYRASYAESFLDTSLATQIRVLREQRGWTQAELAEKAGMKQSRISAIENVNYSKWCIGTLKRLARVFDVPLNVRFGTFGTLLNDVSGFNRASFERPEFDKDPAFSTEMIGSKRMQEWQPIETAPTDGTEVLAWVPNDYAGAGGIELAIFYEGRWIDSEADPIRPTHWMPLPAPPVTSAFPVTVR